MAIAAAAILLHGDPARASSEKANQPPPLWDQYDNPSYGAMNSTDYRPVLDKWDSFGADDFTVPIGFDWMIDGVDVKGFCSGCDFESVNVRFYADDSYRHLPGVLVCDRPTQAFAEAPNLVVDVSPPCDVGAGFYWVSIQPRQDDRRGQWLWLARTVMSGNAGAAWQNPGDGFETGCVSWGRRTECDGALGEPDNVFRLRGKSNPPLLLPPPSQVRCRVPRVIGLRLAKAKTRIRKVRCSVGRVRRARFGRVGRVIGQSPRPGRRLARGTRVNLVVGRR